MWDCSVSCATCSITGKRHTNDSYKISDLWEGNIWKIANDDVTAVQKKKILYHSIWWRSLKRHCSQARHIWNEDRLQTADTMWRAVFNSTVKNMVSIQHMGGSPITLSWKEWVVHSKNSNSDLGIDMYAVSEYALWHPQRRPYWILTA
jgi:hypothetical protein